MIIKGTFLHHQRFLPFYFVKFFRCIVLHLIVSECWSQIATCKCYLTSENYDYITLHFSISFFFAIADLKNRTIGPWLIWHGIRRISWPWNPPDFMKSARFHGGIQWISWPWNLADFMVECGRFHGHEIQWISPSTTLPLNAKYPVYFCIWTKC